MLVHGLYVDEREENKGAGAVMSGGVVRILTAMRFCLRALASATFLIGLASMARKRSFSAWTSSWLIATGGLHHAPTTQHIT